ncbi:phage major capsid protein [Ruoffia sp. FAM 24228]|uniref:phage major capsid protein n=1 Tax=Ruoffia sp. FAM 24228 TaxID=3259517 RepID=UPI0038855D28
MNFKTIEESFNYWNQRTIGEIEERSQQIVIEVDTNPDADIEVLNIEVQGLTDAKANLEDKRSQFKANLQESFNPITGTHNTDNKGDNTNMNNTDIFATEEYRTAFYKDLLNKPLEETEQRALETAEQATHAEKRLDGFNTVTTNAQVIPTLTLNEVVRKARTQGGLLAEARGFNIPSNLKIPVGTPLTVAEWHTEGAEVAGEKTTPTSVEFKGYELIKIFSMSASAKKMSIQAFESYVTDELVSSVMEAIEQSLVNGTGVGQGEGLESIEFSEVNGNLVELSSAPSYTDFTKALGLLKRGYSKNAKFAMNNATLYSLVYGVVDNNNRPIFNPDARNADVGTILGKVIVIDDNIADNEIYLGDFSSYLGYNMPNGIALEVSTQSSFNKGLIDYRALAIADTQVILPEAFVKLATVGE